MSYTSDLTRKIENKERQLVTQIAESYLCSLELLVLLTDANCEHSNEYKTRIQQLSNGLLELKNKQL